jgi:ligand-binding sensor domain-containing protein
MGPRAKCLQKKRYWLCLILVSIAWVLPVRAQHFTFKDYSEAQGLGNLNVRCLLQDRAGFLWVGTEGGIFRYDGTRFQGFAAKDGAPSNLVNSIAEDRSGTIWVGTSKGLTYFDGQVFHAVQYEGQPMKLSGLSLGMSPNGKLLAASKGVLLSVERGRAGNAAWIVKPWPAKNTQEAKALTQVGMFTIRKDGLILFVCGSDICESSPYSFRRYSVADGVPSDRYFHLFFDHEGQSWVLGIRHLLKLPRGESRFLDARPQSNGLIYTIGEDAQGRVLATSIGTVFRWAGEKWETFTSSNGIPNLPITALFKDREGSLWLGPGGVRIGEVARLRDSGRLDPIRRLALQCHFFDFARQFRPPLGGHLCGTGNAERRPPPLSARSAPAIHERRPHCRSRRNTRRLPLG